MTTEFENWLVDQLEDCPPRWSVFNTPVAHLYPTQGSGLSENGFSILEDLYSLQEHENENW